MATILQETPATVNAETIKKTIKKTGNTLESFLTKHVCKTGEVATHTRITGGKYMIPDEELDAFYDLYYKTVVVGKKPDSMTEKQRDGGPMLIDLDFRFNSDVQTRVYTSAHVERFIAAIGHEISNMYDLTSSVDVFLMEKTPDLTVQATVPPVVKDGIHVLVGVPMTLQEQKYVRDKLLDKMDACFGDLPIQNSWDKVLDDSIGRGSTNWQLYGSCKPGKQPYLLTGVYTISGKNKVVLGDSKILNTGADLWKVSARATQWPERDHTLTFIRQLMEMEDQQKQAMQKKQINILSSSTSSSSTSSSTTSSLDDILSVRSSADWQQVVNAWTSKAKPDHKLVHDFVMALPSSYYEFGVGSRDKWIAVCWALRNTGAAMLVPWIDFSAQAAGFTFHASSIRTLLEEWDREPTTSKGLTKRSIMYWCKQDSPAAYAEINKRDIDSFMDRCALNPTHEDLAKILYELYRNDFICTKGNVWYEIHGHRWRVSDNGYGLRTTIKEIRDMYQKKKMNLLEQIGLLNSQAASAADATVGTALQDRLAQMQATQKKMTELCTKLGDTNMKDNIMKEARELFYDADFISKLDEKTGLLCFNNGIVDFDTGVFRRGQPDDFISMCTNIDYVPMDITRCQTETEVQYDSVKHQRIVDDIHCFMAEVYPDPSLREYMWEHLASALTGTENQTFNIYIGQGSNGKSVLTKLMADVLGNYKCDVPLTLITEKRQKVGGCAPEIAELKGVRYAVMQESSKGDSVNEGVLKQLTSGTDTIQGRNLYATGTTRFIPQFKLIMCTNELIDIKSNDGGTWRRMRVVNHVSRFVDNNPDPNPEKHEYKKLTEGEIKRRMTPLWKQLFVSLLVEKAFQTKGIVKDCALVTAASDAYRAKQDLLGEFMMEELIEDPLSVLKKDELSNHYKMWWEKTQNGKVSKKDELWTCMNKKYTKKDKGWAGVRIHYPESSSNSS